MNIQMIESIELVKDRLDKLQKEMRKIRTCGDLFSDDEAVQQAADKKLMRTKKQYMALKKRIRESEGNTFVEVG